MSDYHFVYFVGGPGSGKSTLVKALTAGQPHYEAKRPIPHITYDCGVVEIGAERAHFRGTDATSMSVQPLAVAFMHQLPAKLMMAEGDRLSNSGFFTGVLDAGYELTIVHVATTPNTAATWAAERAGLIGIKPQAEAWTAGRWTKVRNLLRHWEDWVVRLPECSVEDRVTQLRELGNPVIDALLGETKVTTEDPAEYPADAVITNGDGTATLVDFKTKADTAPSGEPEVALPADDKSLTGSATASSPVPFRLPVVEARLRSRISKEELEGKVGKVLTDSDYNVLLTGPTALRMPDGRLLCVYVPGAIKREAEDFYPILTKIRGATDNRGLASGTTRVITGPAQTRTRSMPVMSSILGAADAAGRFPYCRLTVFSANETEQWTELRPLFQRIAQQFETYVPDRYQRQVDFCKRTHPDWVIPDTPFTTITVNNSYSTGVHTDKGDLDEGFSCLAVLRKGSYTGGNLVFPEYRVAVGMHDGDLLLMDAHVHHGNTQMVCECGEKLLNKPCEKCGAERISVVCYYRTNMVKCGSPEDESAKRLAQQEKLSTMAGS